MPGAAVQVTDRTVPAAASRSSRAVQPGMTSVRADATLGRSTFNCVVSAPFSDSPGTRKVSTDVAARCGVIRVGVDVGRRGRRACEQTDGHRRTGDGDGDRAREGAPVVDLIRFGFLVSLGWSVSGRG